MEEEPIIQVQCGALKGLISTTLGGSKYYSFRGIPYAKPPVGELRFKDPVPFGSWEGVRDATKEGDKAAQYSLIDYSTLGSDDCLYLNVHTPKLGDKNLMPVIIQIHGGGFVSGSGGVDWCGPDFLVEKGVVIATMNYRLGVMGFLCTDPENARGDMGLKDQNLSLKWLKDNVIYFGGDPNNITILGVSAGAASVEYHMLSEMSKGLFHKTVAQSGSVFNPWARSTDPVKYALKLAKALGFDSSDKELFEFINSFETKKLVEASIHLLDKDDLKNGMYMPFVPVVNWFKDNKGFLNEEPSDILTSGRFSKTPMISGFCDKEGIFMYPLYRNFLQEEYKEKKFIEFIPSNLNKNFRGGNDRLKEIYKKTPTDKNKEEDLIDLYSDISIVGGVMYSLEQRLLHAEHNQYFYHFVHSGNLTMYKFKSIDGDVMVGVSHADDIGCLLTRSAIIQNPTPDDVIVRRQMVEMWTNFAKTREPTDNSSKIKWLPVQKEKFRYMELNINFEMKTDLKNERRELWREIYSFRVPGMATCSNIVRCFKRPKPKQNVSADQ